MRLGYKLSERGSSRFGAFARRKALLHHPREKPTRRELAASRPENDFVRPRFELNFELPAAVIGVLPEIPPGVPVVFARDVSVAIDKAVELPVDEEAELVGRSDLKLGRALLVAIDCRPEVGDRSATVVLENATRYDRAASVNNP